MLDEIKKSIRNNKIIGPIYLGIGRIYRNTEAKIKFSRKKKAFQQFGTATFQLVAKTLNDAEIEYFPAFGTLLGLVRDGHLIPHDFDFDFGVITEKDEYDWEKLTRVLKDAGFQIVHWFDHGGIVHEMTFAPPMSPYVNIDFFAFTKNGEHYLKYACIKMKGEKYENNRQFSLLEETLPYFNEFRKEEYMGVSLPIPVNAEELLAASYTPSWRTPNPNWKDEDKPNDKIVNGEIGTIHVP